jgi:hypothetical protein
VNDPLPVYDRGALVGYVREERNGQWSAFTPHEIFGVYPTRESAEDNLTQRIRAREERIRKAGERL